MPPRAPHWQVGKLSETALGKDKSTSRGERLALAAAFHREGWWALGERTQRRFPPLTPAVRSGTLIALHNLILFPSWSQYLKVENMFPSQGLCKELALLPKCFNVTCLVPSYSSGLPFLEKTDHPSYSSHLHTSAVWPYLISFTVPIITFLETIFLHAYVSILPCLFLFPC
jgi:hypothetical protein